MSDYLGESEEKLAQPRFAQRAVIAKPTSRSKSKTRVAIVSGATLVLGIFFALRSQKHKVDSTAAGAEDQSTRLRNAPFFLLSICDGLCL